MNDSEIMTPETKVRLRETIEKLEAEIARVEANIDTGKWDFDPAHLAFRCRQCRHLITSVDRSHDETLDEFLERSHLCSEGVEGVE